MDSANVANVLTMFQICLVFLTSVNCLTWPATSDTAVTTESGNQLLTVNSTLPKLSDPVNTTSTAGTDNQSCMVTTTLPTLETPINTASTAGAGNHLLRVNNTLPKLEAPIYTSNSQKMSLCLYAGSVPDEEDITANATTWGCYAIEKGVRTIPPAVYMIKEKINNSKPWEFLQHKFGCTFIKYKVPYLRYQEERGTWILKSKSVPVATTCLKYVPN